MKTDNYYYNLWVILALVVTLSIAGCALFDANASPREKYIAAQELFILTVDPIVEAAKHGIIEKEFYVEKLLPIIEKGYTILERMSVTEDTTTAEYMRLMILEAISELIRIRRENG